MVYIFAVTVAAAEFEGFLLSKGDFEVAVGFVVDYLEDLIVVVDIAAVG